MALNPQHLRRLRRRTWVAIAACIALRASAALAGFDLTDPAAANAPSCFPSLETSS